MMVRWGSPRGGALHLSHPDHPRMAENWRSWCGQYVTGRVVTASENDLRVCPRCMRHRAERERREAA